MPVARSLEAIPEAIRRATGSQMPNIRLRFLTAATLAIGLTACDQPASMEAGAEAQPVEAQPSERAKSGVGREAKKVKSNIGDAAITTKVKSAIVAEPELKAMEIHVDTVDGIVTLTGSVDSPQHIENAKQAAQAVNGVKSVNNQLIVRAAG